jgi:hypothetical protein
MQQRLVRTNSIIATPIARTLPNIWAWPALLTRDWAYAVTGQRDLRIDLLRGFAVFAMIANHFGGASWLYLITGGDTFMVSAAEAFIFISGVTVGIVYGALALKEGLRAAQVKAFKRALTLYKLMVVLTLLFAGVSVLFNLPWSSQIQIDNPLIFAFNVVTMRQTMYLTDIPLMYTLLMLAAPVGLWLLVKRRTLVLLAVSSALWFAFQLFPAQVQVPWPIVGNTTFNLAAWQLLFFGAMAIGFHRNELAKKLGTIPRLPYLLLTGVLLVWLMQFNASQSAAWSRLIPGLDQTPLMSEFFLKSALGPGRLIASAILFQFAFLAVTMLWKPIASAFGWLLLPLGQSALYGYTVHVVIIGLFYATLPHLPGNVMAMGTLNTALQLSVILLIWGLIERRFLFRVVPR